MIAVGRIEGDHLWWRNYSSLSEQSINFPGWELRFRAVYDLVIVSC